MRNFMSSFLNIMQLPKLYLVLHTSMHIHKINITRYISMYKWICLGGINGQLNPETHKTR